MFEKVNYLQSARMTIEIDCVNTPMQNDEEMFLKQEISKIIEERGMKIKKIDVYR